MDWHIERCLNRLALVLAAIGTLSLLHLFTHTSLTCTPTIPTHSSRTQNLTHPIPVPVLLPGPHPNSSCDLLSRAHIPPEKRLNKILLTSPYKSRVRSLSSLFLSLRSLSLLLNSSRVLAVSAGAGHAVVSLHSLGVADVTAVDVVDFAPLVSRGDPHNLPFFDGVFDLAFSDGVDGALFPSRFVGEMERTVRKGGAEAVVVGTEGVEEVVGMFAGSDLVEVRNVTVVGVEMVMIVMRNNGKVSSAS